MKKLIIFVLCLSLTLGAKVRADEGMWLLPLLEKFNIEKMHQLGCELSADDIYNINKSSLKDAIVIFGGGCTGEIISNNGLLITNHHCGYGSIQKLSSVEHDYLKDGFWAMNMGEELPAEGLTVTFIDKFTDVTSRVNNAIKGLASRQREKALKEISTRIENEAKEKDPYIDAEVVSFYNENVFYLVTTKTYKDIRLVGTPPSSIGKFGGDTDNWMWPRHTGDFSMFRVYADRNNNPAEYSEENIPYTPKKFLSISLKGIQENDFAMIIGFPGRTTRFMTSEEAKEAQQISNRISILARGIRQNILMEDMNADPKINIQYASKYTSSSNGWKKWIGMNETFDKLDVIERRAAQEKAFNSWVAENPARTAKYGKAIEKINNHVRNRAGAMAAYEYLTETLTRIELLTAASMANRQNVSQEAIDNFYKDYSVSTDKKVATAMIRLYRDSVAHNYWPSVLDSIDTRYNGDVAAFVEALFEKSLFTSQEGWNLQSDSTLLASDPANIFSKSVRGQLGKIVTEVTRGEDAYNEGKREYLAGILEMNGKKASYPDANFTMRLTYGSVLPYSPRDAVEYNYYTTLDGVMQKENPDSREFTVPAKLKELWKNKEYGIYAMADGKMPVAFLTNNDITGGNSGSPVLNGKGELLGLAFDGNWEAMSGDVIFEPDLQRCIAVDIRYVLFIIDKFGGAGYLLKEMNLIR